MTRQKVAEFHASAPLSGPREHHTCGVAGSRNQDASKWHTEPIDPSQHNVAVEENHSEEAEKRRLEQEHSVSQR
jgi:hypothetical protein